MRKIFISLIFSLAFMFSLTVAVSADSIMMEAEDFSITQNFPTATDSNASGGKYIYAKNTNAEDEDYKSDDEITTGVEAEFSFSVDTTADYVFHIRVAQAGVNKGDSLWYSIGTDTNRKFSRIDFPKSHNNFHWHKITITELEQGKTYSLRLYNREAGAKIDKVLITSNTLYIPEGKVDELPDLEYSELPTPIPTVKPISGHPRVLVRSSDIADIKANLKHPQNAVVFEKVKELAEKNISIEERYNTELLEVMQAKAFMYLLDYAEGTAAVKEIGEDAVEMMLNYINKFSMVNQSASADTMRNAGHVIFTTACVYDWCYDLIKNEDKLKYIAKCEELAKKYFEGGYPIVEQPGNINKDNHRDENPLYKDLLALGIAVYDEYDFIYNDVVSVLSSNYIPFENYVYPSGWNHQGVYTYGIFRTYWEVISACLLDAGTDGEFFSDAQKNMAYKYVYSRRPDGSFIMDADENEGAFTFNNTFLSIDNSLFFLVGNLYKDPTIKWQYYHDKAETEYTNRVYTGVTAPMYLLLNDVSVGIENNLELPYTQYYGSPVGAMIARTGWDEGPESPTAIAVMKPFENYFSAHMHREVGSFQFYYKGMLALDSGAYEAPAKDGYSSSVWGTPHYMNYLSAPIAHNILAVYNPSNPSEISNGGQRLGAGGLSALTTYDEFMNGSHKTGEIIGYDYGPDKHEPEYSYIEGDLTSGYRSDRVEDYSRSFMFLNLFDDEIPAALIVFDRMESTSANLTKSWLLHSQEEPAVSGNNVTIRRSEWHNSGRLTNTVLMPQNHKIEKIGGEGYEYWNGENNLEIYRKPVGDESGTWRVEISPTTDATNDYFLNVMQVSDNDNSITPLEVTSNEQGEFVAVFIADRAVFMKKDKGSVSTNFSVTASGSGDISYIITNLAEGLWTVKDVSGNTVTTAEVDSEHGVLRFRAAAGKYYVSYAAQSVSPKTFDIKQDAKTLSYSPVSVFVNNNHYDGHAIVENDVVMMSLDDIARLTNSNCDINNGAFVGVGENGSIKGTVSSNTAIVNGVSKTLTATPVVYDDILYVPLDLLNSAYEFTYNYDSLTHILYLKCQPATKIMVNDFLIDNLRWHDNTGNVTETLTSGNKVTATAALTAMSVPSGSQPYSVMLYAALYDGDEIVKIDTAEGKFTSVGDTCYYDLELNVPNEAGEYTSRLFMWDGNSLKPLAMDSGNHMGINGITLGGKKVDGFTPSTLTYNVTIPFSLDYLPKVICSSDTIGTLIETVYSNNSVKLDVNGTTYTLQYTMDNPN